METHIMCVSMFRRRPTFPGGCPPSIIGAKELNYCVRYGYRCDLLAIVTECLFKTESEEISEIQTYSLFYLLSFLLGQALDLLVSVSLMRYHTYTSDLSTT